MDIHLYTTLSELKQAKKREFFYAWTKELKKAGDIHISVKAQYVSIEEWKYNEILKEDGTRFLVKPNKGDFE